MDKIENCINLCEKTNTIIFSTSFFPMIELNKIKNNNLKFLFKGLNEGAEKKIIAVYPKDFPEEYINFPIKFFKIIKKSKFISLEHKHYLGSILSLGIKREVLGDLIVKNQVCYGIILENMFDFLKDNLTKINSSPVEIEEILESDIPENEFLVLNTVLSSLRLDSVVSAITNLSRNEATSYIDLGNVQVNYEVQREKSFKINISDTIIIKKYGKFIIFENKGLNKKEKIKLVVKKYI